MAKAALASSKFSSDLLRLEGVRSGYGSIDVIEGVDLSIRQGEIFALMGRTGWERPPC